MAINRAELKNKSKGMFGHSLVYHLYLELF